MTRSRKIRFYPNRTQRQTLRNWFGCARYVYNRTVEYLRQPNTKADWKAIKGGIINALPEWAKQTPYQIKSIAVRDACRAVKNAKAKYRKTGKRQRVNFRSKRQRRENIFIPKSAVKNDSFYCRTMGKINFREEVDETKYDCRVTYRQGRYFLVKPEDRVIKVPDSQRNRLVALDPGVRTFQTFYSQDYCGFIGKYDFGRICRLCHYMDDLISRMSQVKCKARRRMRKALDRIRWKVRDLIAEIHHKTADFLCRAYDVVVIPPFETSEMVVRSMRKIRSKTVRAMLTWAHYRFKEILKAKAELLSVTVYDKQSEAYTSKTCSACGYVYENLCGRKVFRCKRCGAEIDRDINGARGIFLRALVDTPSLASLLV